MQAEVEAFVSHKLSLLKDGVYARQLQAAVASGSNRRGKVR